MNRRTLIVLVLVALTATSTALARKWHSRSGNSSVEAEMVDFRNGKVILKRDDDGRLVQVPLEHLSLADVRYVTQVLEEAEAAVRKLADAKSKTPFTPDGSSPPADTPAADTRPATPLVAEPPLAKQGGGWQVAVDPPVEPIVVPDDVELTVPIRGGMGSSLLVPLQRSPFVLLRTGGTFDKKRQIWDVRSAEMVTVVPAENGILDVSPDGRHYASVPTHKGKILVYSVEKGLPVHEFELSHWAARTHFLGFAGSSRLVAALDRSKQIAVWDLSSGEKTASYSCEPPSGRYAYAISPGGNYVAFPESGLVRFLDVRNGVPAGQLTLPPGTNGALKIEALSFSPDGEEFAALLADGPGSALVVWSVSDGQQVVDLRFEKHLKKTVTGAGGYQGHPLAWFPDHSAWLAYGRGVVDREIGGPVWIEKLPADGHAPGEPRVLLDGQRLVGIAGTKNEPRLEIIRLSPEEIAAGAELVSSGATAKDANLPPLSIADLSAAKSVTLVRQPNQWKYQPDGAAAHIEFDGPIDLSVKHADVRMLLMAAGAGKALVASEDPQLPNDGAVPTGRIVDRFDLEARRREARFAVPFPTTLLDADRDGETLLFRIRGDEDRLDLWSLADGKHVAGFRPYTDQPPDAQKVTWARLIEPQLLLTSNAQGRFVAWRLPQCQALYTLHLAPQAIWSLNPSHTRLLVYHDGEMHFLDTQTGQCVVTLASPKLEGGFGLSATAFSPDDERLAAVVTSGGQAYFVAWDLTRGRVATLFPLSRGAAALSWAGADHVLLRDAATHQLSLVSLAQETIVWRYTLAAGRHAAENPDGRHWVVVGDPATPYAHLVAVDLPDEQALKLIEEAPALKPLVGRGSEVALEVTFDRPPEADKRTPFVNDAKAHFVKALLESGIKVAPRAAITLHVRLDETPTEDTVTYREFGFRYLTVPVSKLKATLSFVGSDGKPFWTRSSTYVTGRQSGFIEHIPSDADAKTYIRMKQWHAAMSWFKATPIPKRVYHDDVVDGLGESKLTPAGPVRVKTVKEVPAPPKEAESDAKVA